MHGMCVCVCVWKWSSRVVWVKNIDYIPIIMASVTCAHTSPLPSAEVLISLHYAWRAEKMSLML